MEILVGTTTATSPIVLASNTTAIVRSLTLTSGTWLLNAVVNARCTTIGPANLHRFTASFSGGLAQVELSGLTTSITGTYFGTCLSDVVQVGGATNVDLEVNASFSISTGGQLHISETDDKRIHFTATRLA